MRKRGRAYRGDPAAGWWLEESKTVEERVTNIVDVGEGERSEGNGVLRHVAHDGCLRRGRACRTSSSYLGKGS